MLLHPLSRKSHSPALSPGGSSPSRAHISPPRSRMSPSRIGFRHLREQLQMYIDREAADWRTYLSLSAARPAGVLVLAAMAAEERRHAKRLSAAFSHLRVRISPPSPSAHARGALPAALRQCCAEQRGRWPI